MIWERMIDKNFIFFGWRCLNCGKIICSIKLPTGSIVEIDEVKLRSLGINDLFSPEFIEDINHRIKEGEEVIPFLTISGRVMQVLDSIVKIRWSPHGERGSVIDLPEYDYAFLISFFIAVVTSQELLFLAEFEKIRQKYMTN